MNRRKQNVFYPNEHSPLFIFPFFSRYFIPFFARNNSVLMSNYWTVGHSVSAILLTTKEYIFVWSFLLLIILDKLKVCRKNGQANSKLSLLITLCSFQSTYYDAVTSYYLWLYRIFIQNYLVIDMYFVDRFTYEKKERENISFL